MVEEEVSSPCLEEAELTATRSAGRARQRGGEVEEKLTPDVDVECQLNRKQDGENKVDIIENGLPAENEGGREMGCAAKRKRSRH